MKGLKKSKTHLMGLKKEIKNTFFVSNQNSIKLKNENGSHLDELASTTNIVQGF